MVSVEDTELLWAEVTQIVQRSIQQSLNSVVYSQNDLDAYTNKCIEGILTDLREEKKPFKFAVTVILSQKVGAGLVTSGTFYWDPETDGCCKITWENAELQAVITVFAICTEPFAEHRPSRKDVLKISLNRDNPEIANNFSSTNETSDTRLNL